MSDTSGAGAFDPDAAAIPPQGEPQPPILTSSTPQPPQPGPTFRAPLGPTEARDPFAQPAWPEIADAAFKKSNTIASTLSFLSGRSPDMTFDPNWNPLSLIKGSEFENQPELFVGDLNKDQTAARMARMRAENQRNTVLAQSGSAGIVMSLIAGGTDVVNYLPIFGEYAAATRFGQVAYDAARLGAFGAATAGVSEAAMHATQETRTWKESAGNIASATLLMGMLGGTLGALAPVERAAMAAELDAARPKVGVDPATGEMQVHPQETANVEGARGGAGGVGEVAQDQAAQEAARREALAQTGLIERGGEVFTDTRGAGVQYHGTSNPDLQPSGDHYSTKNYYGQGFYTTDAAPDIAWGYSKRGSERTGGRHLYQVQENHPLNILDGEAPLSGDVGGMFEEMRQRADRTGSELDGIVADALDTNPKNLRELFDQIRDAGTADGLSADTVQEMFDAVTHGMQQLGYDGFSHTGGLRTKNAPHKVVIYFNPEKDLTLTRRSVDEFRSTAPGEVGAAARAGEAGAGPLQEGTPVARGAGLPDVGKDGGTSGIGEPALARSVGAAASDLRDLDLKNFGLNQLGRLSEATIDKLSPNLRVYTGESLTAKRAMGDLAETALKFTQHDEGVPTASGGGALETMFRTAQKQMQYAAHTVVKDAWLEHRGLEGSGLLTRGATAITDFRGAPEGKLSFKDFKSAVWDAMDQGDEHAIMQVQDAAKQLRKIVYDPMGKMAEQTLGPDGQPMLSEFREPPKGSQSFVDRIWNKQAIIQKRPDAVRRFADYYETEQARHAEVQSIISSLQKNRDRAAAEEARLTEAAAKKSGPERADLEYDARMQRAAQDRIRKGIEEQLGRWGGNTTKEALAALKKRGLAEERGGGQVERLTGADDAVDNAVKRTLDRSDLDMSREELENLANETVDRILSTPDGRIPYEGDHITSGQGAPAQQARGSLNERRFAIPSQDVKDFLERDIEHVVAAHIRTVLPDVLLTQRFGDIRMTDQIRGILEDYAAKSSKEGISGREAARLNKLKDRDIADVTAVRDRLRGTYGWTPDPTMRNVGQVIHAFHNYTTITSLGTSALNRLNDWGMQSIFRNGFMNTLGDMWAPMLKGMLQIDKEGSREIVRQARDMGIGVDGMLGHARYNLGDVTDNLRPGNTFTRGLAWGADRSMIVNLHGPETDYARIFNWVAAQAEFGRVAEKIAGGTATKKDFARMADANIDPHTASRIWAEYEQHHNVVGGTRLANTGAWTDTVARDAFERAMNREANINVVQAGIGDKPLFLSRPLGSLIGQFKSFTAGATERILIANLQQGDARTLQGVISGIAMGMLGYRLYTLASGQPVSDRPQDWLKEGIIRSGMTGWLMEGNNTLAKFTSGKSDVFRAIGADRPSSRRASETALSDLLGPTFSHLEGVTTAIGHATYTDPKTGASAFTARDIHNLRQAGVLPVPPFVFQNLMGLRRIGDEFEDGIAASLGVKPMSREPHWQQ